MITQQPNKGGPADRWPRRSFSKVIFISKVSALSEFIVYLPTASDHIVELSRYAAEGGRPQCFPHRAFFHERPFNQQIKTYKIIDKRLPIFAEGFVAVHFAAYLNVELSRCAAEGGRPQCFPHRAFFSRTPVQPIAQVRQNNRQKIAHLRRGIFCRSFCCLSKCYVSIKNQYDL